MAGPSEQRGMRIWSWIVGANALTRTSGRRVRDSAVVLMLTAVIGTICQIADTIIELGRSAGWWH